jgi:exopolyphosphatase/pppGpp-phosphohydrolase
MTLPTVLLQIDADHTVLAVDGQPVAALPVGSRRTADQCFRHDPPRAIDIERAIEVVEDQVMPWCARLPAGAVLVARDAGVHEIARLAGVDDMPHAELTRDALERVFNRLADVASGSPVAASGLPVTPAFAARLVILREALHHLGFDRLRIEA